MGNVLCSSMVPTSLLSFSVTRDGLLTMMRYTLRTHLSLAVLWYSPASKRSAQCSHTRHVLDVYWCSITCCMQHVPINSFPLALSHTVFFLLLIHLMKPYFLVLHGRGSKGVYFEGESAVFSAQ